MMNHQRIEEIGRRIAAIRNHWHMTERELGAAIGHSGKSISGYEHGHVHSALLAQLDDIAFALGCARDDLLAPLDAPMPRLYRARKCRLTAKLRWRDKRQAPRGVAMTAQGSSAGQLESAPPPSLSSVPDSAQPSKPGYADSWRQ